MSADKCSAQGEHEERQTQHPPQAKYVPQPAKPRRQRPHRCGERPPQPLPCGTRNRQTGPPGTAGPRLLQWPPKSRAHHERPKHVPPRRSGREASPSTSFSTRREKRRTAAAGSRDQDGPAERVDRVETAFTKGPPDRSIAGRTPSATRGNFAQPESRCWRLRQVRQS